MDTDARAERAVEQRPAATPASTDEAALVDGAKAVRKLVRGIAAAEARLVAKYGELRTRRGELPVQCACCLKFWRIRDLTLIQMLWYESPHGCTGGDAWHDGEWRFVCPGSGADNRMLFFGDYKVRYEDRRKVGVAAEPTFKRHFREAFAKVEEWQDNRRHARWVNNEFVDKNREFFGLPAAPATQQF